ncbi:hypothetical protein NLX86_21460 [Streptomyces sp. A3M-1-3]|uniref:hypothetical protein n=1 Tax=Streptomyces sp. A3M-1-3 TaxID=2962044 RepID=UPI0020B6D395|nr:hypothetical protein [Streptomyces sp. A3M-1-3]MCP3820568.1 hypothetical protein [Streptomyces sp. A3M-1-3]
MHGPAPAPPARPAASVGVIAVRVIISVLTVLSLGLLSWVAMLRIAIMRGRGKDWVLFWGQLVLNVSCLGMLHTAFADSWISDAGMAGLLITAVAVVIHYLIADLHHHQRPHQAGAPIPMPVPPVPYGPPQPGYGYPPPQTGTPVPGHTPTPIAPQPQPQPQHPAPPRIDQVRAELDELSDYLRRKEGR